MTATSHALIALAAGAKISNPPLAILLVFFSHFAADAVPHWDAGTNGNHKTKRKMFVEAVIDTILSFIVIIPLWYFFKPHLNVGFIFLLVFVSQLPDYLEVPYLFLNWNFPPFSWVYRFQHFFHHRLPLPWGLVTQIIILLPLLFFALR